MWSKKPRSLAMAGWTVLFAAILQVVMVDSHAQVAKASLSGTVYDSSGAAVPRAGLTLTNLARNTSLTIKSNEVGRFYFGDLGPGAYRLEATAQGFSTYLASDILVTIGQHLELDPTLQVGSAEQRIEVSATAAGLDTASSTLSAVVDNSQVANLPLNGRQALGLLMLVPNVHPGQYFDPSAPGGYFAINGGRNETVEMELDGSPDTYAGSNMGTQKPGYQPTVDAIQEFRVLTNTLSAEYGNTGGGVISMATKSGTNSLHGSAYDYLRNSKLDSNNFFSNLDGIPLGSYKRNQFGGSLGGPVVIPMYNGKNRTFFFVDYDGLRARIASFSVETVPTLKQKQGDFSQTLDAAGNLVTIFDPTTTRPSPSGSGYIRDPFPGNLVPQSRFDPVSKNFLQFWPAPNTPGALFTQSNNFITSGPAVSDWNQVDIRIDHRFNDAHSLYGRYSENSNISNPPAPFGVADLSAAGKSPSQHVVVDYTFLKSPVTILNIHYGASWVRDYDTVRSEGYDISSLGFSPNFTNLIQYKVLSTVSVSNISPIGAAAAYDAPYSLHQFNGSVTHIHGNQTVKVGVDVRRYRLKFFDYYGPGGSFGFGQGYTQGPNALVAAPNAGSGFASFLLGAGSGTAWLQPTVDIRAPTVAAYVQDDWKVSRKLTLNLGLRWDLFVPRTEPKNQLSWFNPTVSNPLSEVTGLDLKGGLQFAGQNGEPTRQFNTELHDFSPRFGFAYALTPKTVMRAGYAIMYALPSSSVSGWDAGLDGFTTATSWVSSDTGLTPVSYFQNAFATGLVQPSGGSQGLLTLVGGGMTPVYRDMKNTYNEQWNFGIERSVLKNSFFDISYVGSRGVHLPVGPGYLAANQLTPQQMALGSELLQQVPNPFYGIITTPGVLSGRTTTYGQLLRPFPEFNSVLNFRPTVANSIYHGLAARFKTTFKDGYQVELAYTKSKLIDDSSDSSPTGIYQLTQNSYDLRADRSISSQDVSQRFVMSFQAPLPFGRRRVLLGNTNSFVNAIVGGWQANGILTKQTGIPLEISAPNTTYSYGLSERPNSTGKSAELSGPVEDRLNRYFDTSQFVQPPPFTFGNVSRTLPDARGPGLFNLDFSLFKNFSLREGLRLQFRAEAFNLTNTPIFGLPGMEVGTPNFGVITYQANTPREVQLALRLDF